MRLAILAFAAGTLWVQSAAVLPPSVAYGVGGLVVGAASWLSRRTAPWLRLILCCLAAFMLGVAWAASRAEGLLSEALPLALEGQDIRITGQIDTLPQRTERGWRFEFAVDPASTVAHGIPVRLLLSLGASDLGRGDNPTETPQIDVGQRWRFDVRLKRPHGNVNPGGFDYEAWLLERGIRATGYVRPRSAVWLGAADGTLWQWIELGRSQIRQRFEQHLPEVDYPWRGVLIALAIGDQRAIPSAHWTIFNRTGTTHLNSISGLHVTLVAALFGHLLSFCWRRIPALALRWPAQQAGLLGAAAAALGYAALAGFAIPAQRTAYMLAVTALAMLARRQLAPSRILALALCCVLVLDPWAGMSAGFWLSFCAVGALLYIGGGVRAQALNWRQKLLAWQGVQWAATLASLPIVLLLFQQFSLVSPLANALAIPVVSLVVTPLALLASLLPGGALMVLAHVVLSGLMAVLGWLAVWPVWQAPAPPLWVAILAGVGVIIALLPRGVPGRYAGLALVIPALAWPPQRLPVGEARIDVLDVGQGLAVVVRTARHTLIYDPGPLYGPESDAGQRVVVPYLRHEGVDRIDMMMVTHRDSDHSGGAASVLSALPVDEVRSSVAGMAGTRCAAGQRWEWDGVVFVVLHPAEAAPTVNLKSNHLSCVLRISAGGRHVLLTADIEAEDEAHLLQAWPSALPADVLLVPHHGSRTSSTPAFLAAVGARDVIFPVGYRNRFGHPAPLVLARHVALGSRLWRTDADGCVRIHLSTDAVRLEGARAARARYWHGR